MEEEDYRLQYLVSAIDAGEVWSRCRCRLGDPDMLCVCLLPRRGEDAGMPDGDMALIIVAVRQGSLGCGEFT